MELEREELTGNDEAVLLSVNTLLLLQNTQTYFTIVILESVDKCTVREIKEIAVKNDYPVTVNQIDASIELLHTAGIVILGSDEKYTLNEYKIKDINKAVKLLGKGANNLHSYKSKGLLNSIRTLVKDIIIVG